MIPEIFIFHLFIFLDYFFYPVYTIEIEKRVGGMIFFSKNNHYG